MSKRAFFATAAAMSIAATALITPVAHAAGVEASHRDGDSIFNRSVSSSEVVVGQTLTYTQSFERKARTDAIYSWTNKVNSCLEYVPGSAKLNIADQAQNIEASQVKATTGSTTISAPEGKWTYAADQPHTFQLSYRVTQDCANEQTLESGFSYEYDGWFGKTSKDYTASKFNGGPAAQVVAKIKTASTTTLSPLPEYVAVGVETPLIATVQAADGAAVAGQSITFQDGSETLCSAKINAEGFATCKWKPASLGDKSVKARFGGTDAIAASESETYKVKVLSAVPKQPQDLTFTEEKLNDQVHTIVSGKATPGAVVEALAPGGNRCVATADEDGNFSCNLGYLPAGKERGVAVTEKIDGVQGEVATLVGDVAEGNPHALESFLQVLRKIGFGIQDFFKRLFDPNTWVAVGSA